MDHHLQSFSTRIQILVADDEPVDRVLLRAALRQLGHDCLEAGDGDEAWRIFQQCRPDIVISDWRMPGMDGAKFCQLVRTYDSVSYTPFIFLTGLNDRGHALSAMEAGADDFLTKPLDIDNLRARLLAAQRLKSVENERFDLLARERAAREAAEQAVRRRDEVLAAVSHDLCTPLTTIKATAQLQHRRLLAGTLRNDRLEQSLEGIVAAVDRMNSWIADLVDVSQIQAGQRLSLHRVSTDLVVLIQNTLDDQPHTDRHAFRLEALCPPPVLLCDPTRLRRVLENLLSNAVKYSPKGGEIVVGVGLDTDGFEHWAKVSVSDRGIGIPVEDLQSLFSWPWRATNVGRITGSGLGLAVAKGVVEQHGGRLEVESTEGVGSIFSVHLPMREPPAP